MSLVKDQTPGIFVFNGDADGLCATHQLRLSGIPCKQTVTGVKRDISLLKKIKQVQSDCIYVLDVAVEKNLAELESLLSQDCNVTWFDHHLSREIPVHPAFSPQIDTDANTNTSLLVSQALKHEFVTWAIVGLFGDNLHDTAKQVANAHGLGASEQAQLKELGELINYNAYGGTLDDLHFHPADLLEQISPFEDPFAFLKATTIMPALREGREGDLAFARQAERLHPGVIRFPNEQWARRVVGIYANRLAQANPKQAHAVVVASENEGYVVSVRSALNGKQSAAELCSQFATGGGRVRAAGINHLPEADLLKFISEFQRFYGDDS